MPLLGSIGSDSKGNYGYDRVTYGSRAFYSGIIDTNAYYSANVANGYYPNDTAYSVAVDANNNSFVVGKATIFVSGATVDGPQTFGYIAKYDVLGNVLWIKGLRGNLSGASSTVSTVVSSVQVGPLTGNIYVAGTAPIGGNLTPQVFLASFDTNGNLLWNKIFYATTNSNIYPNCLIVDPSENIFLGGSQIGTAGYNWFMFSNWRSDGSLVSATGYTPSSPSVFAGAGITATALCKNGNGSAFLIAGTSSSGYQLTATVNVPGTGLNTNATSYYTTITTNAPQVFNSNHNHTGLFYDSVNGNYIMVTNNASGVSYAIIIAASGSGSYPGTYLYNYKMDGSANSDQWQFSSGAFTTTQIGSTIFPTFMFGGTAPGGAGLGRLIVQGTNGTSLYDWQFANFSQTLSTGNQSSGVNAITTGTSTLTTSLTGTIPRGNPLFMACNLGNGYNYTSGGKIALTSYGSTGGLWSFPSNYFTNLSTASSIQYNYSNQNPNTPSNGTAGTFSFVNTATPAFTISNPSNLVYTVDANNWTATNLISAGLWSTPYTSTMTTFDALTFGGNTTNGFGSYLTNNINSPWNI